MWNHKINCVCKAKRATKGDICSFTKTIKEKLFRNDWCLCFILFQPPKKKKGTGKTVLCNYKIRSGLMIQEKKKRRNEIQDRQTTDFCIVLTVGEPKMNIKRSVHDLIPSQTHKTKNVRLRDSVKCKTIHDNLYFITCGIAAMHKVWQHRCFLKLWWYKDEEMRKKTNRCIVESEFLIWNGIVQWLVPCWRVSEDSFRGQDTNSAPHCTITHITAAGGGGGGSSVAKYQRPFIHEYPENAWQISS